MTRRRILVPIDFSTQSDFALEYAAGISAGINAMISCIYVIEEQRFLADKMGSGEFRHKLRREAENRLSERVNSVLNKEDKVPFELIITAGKVFQKVLEKSIDLNAQIIVMGKSNSKDNKTTRIGSNTKRIIAKSLIPVIAVCKQTNYKRMHLILPLDLTRPYENQMNWAIHTAMLLGASVSLLSVIEQDKIGLRPVYLKKLKESTQLFRNLDIECTFHMLENSTTVPREILSFSNRKESGLILIMTRREKTGVSSGLGFVANEVIVNSDVPVQCINPGCSPRFSLGDSLLNDKPGTSTLYPLEDQFIDNRYEI